VLENRIKTLCNQLISLAIPRHSREGGNPDFQPVRLRKVWIPSFEGMTEDEIAGLIISNAEGTAVSGSAFLGFAGSLLL
jgi:hypothetical protein